MHKNTLPPAQLQKSSRSGNNQQENTQSKNNRLPLGLPRVLQSATLYNK